MNENDKLKTISLHNQSFSVRSIMNSFKSKYNESEIMKVIIESEITIDSENFIIPSSINYSISFQKYNKDKHERNLHFKEVD